MLAEALKIVVGKKGNTKRQIDVNSMRAAAERARSSLDEKNWGVMTYLRKHGESSASDDGLRRSLDYKKASRADGYHPSVDRRLREVAKKLRLDFDEVPTGRTKKKVLRFPTFSLD